MFHLGGFSILIDAEKGDIEVETGVFKIVRVAAIEGDLLFGGEHKPHIGILFESVKVINPALVKGDHIRP